MSVLEASRVDTARGLAIDLLTAEVAQAWRLAGIECILLKGPSFALWFYPDGGRSYVDSDLLVNPTDCDRAEAILSMLGFVRQPRPRLRGDRPLNACTWRRPDDAGAVDLHTSLFGVGVETVNVWDVLASRRESALVGGCEVAVLDEVGRAVHVVLHAAQHCGLGPMSRPAEDMRRALEIIPFARWQEAAALAWRLGAADTMGAGLRSTASGVDLADRLGLPRRSPLEVVLRRAGASPEAVSFAWLAERPGILAKVTLVGRKLLPPPDYLRAWRPLARAGFLGLLVAYAWRPFWLAARTPGAVLTWLRARRAS